MLIHPANVAHFKDDLTPTRRRLERNTYLVLAVLVVGSLLVGQWPIILGVVLGGGLGLLNVRWLDAGLMAIIADAEITGRAPKRTAWKFVLRYGVVGLGIGLALWSGYVDLAAMIVSFCAFVWAVMIEAGYQVYLMLSRRGE